MKTVRTSIDELDKTGVEAFTGEDDELARIVGPIDQSVKVERTPEGLGRGGGLHPAKGVSMADTPPAFHIALHSLPVRGDATVHRNHARQHNGAWSQEGHDRAHGTAD